MQKGLYVECLSLKFNQNLNVLANLCKNLNLKFQDKLSCGSPAVQCRRTDRETDKIEEAQQDQESS